MNPADFVAGFSAALLVGAAVLAAGAVAVALRAPSHRSLATRRLGEVGA